MSDIQKAAAGATEEAKVVASATAASKVIDQAEGELATDDLDNVSGGSASRGAG